MYAVLGAFELRQALLETPESFSMEDFMQRFAGEFPGPKYTLDPVEVGDEISVYRIEFIRMLVLISLVKLTSHGMTKEQLQFLYNNNYKVLVTLGSHSCTITSLVS